MTTNLNGRIFILLLIIFCPFFYPECFAQENPGKLIPLDPLIRKGRLPNGFTYYIRHNGEPKNRVIFYLANKVGSILENDDQQGLAHFMEHMSFNGTKHFPKSELVNYLQKAGVRFGADLNAYTGFDETVYQLPLPSDNPEIVSNGLQIMRDWAQDATLDTEEINKERGVILEEKRLGKGANERMQRVYWPILLNKSKYASRIPIGTDEVLNNFKPDVIKSFYHDWYRPDLQALIVVGDIDVDAMEQRIIAKFGDLKNPEAEKTRTVYSVPLTGQSHFAIVTDKEMPATVSVIVSKLPGLSKHTVADYRQGLNRKLFNNLISSRLGEIQRKADPPFIQADAGISEFLGGVDQFGFSVVARPGELERGFKAAYRELERIKYFGFTSTEFARAKDNLLSDMEAATREKNKTGSDTYVNACLQNFLKGTAAPGIDEEYAMVKKNISDISLNELNLLAKATLKPTGRDMLILAPEKDKVILPAETQFEKWLTELEGEKLLPYKDDVSNLPLLKFTPVPGKIVSENKDSALNITSLVMNNGVRILLKPTDFKDNEILFSSYSQGGTALYSDAEFQSASNAAGIISSFGAGNYNATQLEKFLSGKQLSVGCDISERTQGVGGSAAPNDFVTAMQLTYAYLVEPRKDTGLFKSTISRTKDGLANREIDPGNLFRDTVMAILGNYNIRRTGPSLEKVDQINLDSAFRIYRERFANANGMVFTFVGNFKIDEIKPLLEQYIGSLPSQPTLQTRKDLDIHIPPGKKTKIVYKGTEPKANVLLVYSGDFDYSQAENIKLDGLKECLQIRLIERLREDESGVYSPGVYINIAKYPAKRFSFVINFGCSPENADKLIASTQDEINKLMLQGPLQVNLDKWRAESLRVHETNLRNNQWWLGYLNDQGLNNEDLHQLNNYNSLLNNVSTADLKELANKYLNGNNFIRLELLPENNSKP